MGRRRDGRLRTEGVKREADVDTLLVAISCHLRGKLERGLGR